MHLLNNEIRSRSRCHARTLLQHPYTSDHRCHSIRQRRHFGYHIQRGKTHATNMFSASLLWTRITPNMALVYNKPADTIELGDKSCNGWRRWRGLVQRKPIKASFDQSMEVQIVYGTTIARITKQRRSAALHSTSGEPTQQAHAAGPLKSTHLNGRRSEDEIWNELCFFFCPVVLYSFTHRHSIPELD